MRVQVMCLQRLGYTESVEHAANALDAQAPEGSFTVLVHQSEESVQLLRSSRVKPQLAAFPARPGVGGHAEQLCRLSLREVADSTSQIQQVQI